MVSTEFDVGADGSNCSWWADGGTLAGMIASPSGTLVGVFDVGAGLSIGGAPSVAVHKLAPTGTQPLMSWHGAVSFGLAEPCGILLLLLALARLLLNLSNETAYIAPIWVVSSGIKPVGSILIGWSQLDFRSISDRKLKTQKVISKTT